MAHIAKVTLTRGEVTPLVHARADMELYRAAAKTLQNWYVLKEGGIRRTPGTKYCGAVKYSDKDTRLADFVFSSTQAYVLEMGDLYTRFWTDGAQILDGPDPYEIVSPFAEANLRSIQWAQTFDVMFFAHASTTIPTKKLLRHSHTSWEWKSVDFVDGPYLPINDQENLATVSAIPYPGTTVTVTHASVTNVNGGAGFATTDVGRHYRIEINGTWAWGRIATRVSTTQITLAVVDSGFSPNANNGVWHNGVFGADGNQTIQLGSGTNDVTTADVGRTIQYFSSDTSGTYFAPLVRLGDATHIVVGTAIAIYAGALASKSWRLGAFSETTGYPGAISWFQGRLCLGRTDANPNTFWYSCTGIPEKFQPSDFDGTVTDSHGGMVSTLGRADEILWLHEAPRLQSGTTGAIRSAGGTDSNDAFGPRNVSQRLEQSGGISNVLPVSVGPSTVHVQRFGKKISDLYFDFNVNSLVEPDISVLAEHMFDSGIKELWFQQSPDSLLWALLNDGTLVTTTIERYEKVIGFSRQPRDEAEILSACVIPGAAQDDLYMVVGRNINGSNVQYMELLQPRFLRNDPADAWFVDCGAKYDDLATNTVSGITWLEGEYVDVLADGFPYTGLQITDGVLTLPNSVEATKIIFGKTITNRGGVLPPPIDAPDGSSKGRKMRVVEVIADVYETAGLKFISNTGQEDTLVLRPPSTPMDEPDPLYTGKKKLKIDGSWQSEGIFEWTIVDPLPGTIRALNIGLDYEP